MKKKPCKFFWFLFVEAATRGVLRKKDVIRNFTKFSEKHLCQCLFFNKVAGLRPAILLEDSGTGVFL